MFNPGDAVVYGNSGVCIIDDIRLEEFLGKKEMYYILKPVFIKGSTIFCPVNNVKITMRGVVSKEDIAHLLNDDSAVFDSWNENELKRRELFSATLKKCDIKETAALVRILLKKKADIEDCGRKFHVSDEKILSDAEKTLFGEIAYVSGISYDEASELFKKVVFRKT